MNQMTPEELEQFIHQNLRALPPRRAPRTLEARVFAELERRNALTWWHRSYTYWPAWARATFLAAGVGAVGKLTLLFWVFWQTDFDRTGFAQAFAPWFEFAGRIAGLAGWVADCGARVFAGIPPLWLYGGLALVAALYATFFGLSAVAYRTLYRRN